MRLIKKKKVLPKKNSDGSSDTDEENDGKISGVGEEVNSDDEKEDRVAELGPEIVAKLRDDNVDYARGKDHFDHLMQFLQL